MSRMAQSANLPFSLRNRSSIKLAIAGLATTLLVPGGLWLAGLGLAAGAANADTDHCSTRSGCYKGPGDRWCPGDYVWPGLVATGWDLTVCHVYHEECPAGYYGGCPDNIVEGPPPPYTPGLNFCPFPPWCP